MKVEITNNSTEKAKRIIREYNYNCMPTNWITYMKWKIS